MGTHSPTSSKHYSAPSNSTDGRTHLFAVPTGCQLAKSLSKQFSNGDGSWYSTQSDSWNLGLRSESNFTTSITKLISHDEARNYSNTYFTKIHRVYSIIDQERFEQRLQDRWKPRASSSEQDAVICAVVALGSLFSGADAFPKEIEVAELAKTILDVPSQRANTASFEKISAWIVLTLYLRMGADPHSAWSASRSAIRAIEGDDSAGPGGGLDTSCGSYLRGDDEEGRIQNATHARLHWIAHMLHLWICNEYSAFQASRRIVNIACTRPSPIEDPQDFTPLLITIFHLGLKMSITTKRMSLGELTDLLVDINNLPLEVHDALQLHKSNHAFCIYRFMRLTTNVIPRSSLMMIIEMGKPGLSAALRLAEDHQPWWHVVHVPFQLLCVLLSMDTRESLEHVEEAMMTLRKIEECFRTPKMGKIVAMADSLVRMCQKSKIEAAATLGKSSPMPGTGVSSVAGDSRSAPQLSNTLGNFAIPPTAEAAQSAHDSALDCSQFDLAGFNWDEFMNLEFPMDLSGFE